mgnify:FL=1
MAQIQTYPRKSSYDGNDLFIVCNKTPDSTGFIDNKTMSITLSTIVSAAGLNLTLTTNGSTGPALLNGTILNIPNYAAIGVNSITASGAGGTVGDLAFGTVSPTTGNVKVGYAITGLTEVTSSTERGDLLLVVDDPSGTPINKKISFTNMMDTATLQASASQSGFLSSSDFVAFSTGSGVSQITAGTNITISPSGGTGNVTVTAATPEEPAFSPNPIYTGTAQVASNTLAMFMFKAKATSTMSPTRLIMNFGGATSTDFISVAIYKGVIADASLYASSVNNSMASNGDITFSLTLASGATAINQASDLIVVLSIKGGGTSDTILMNSGYSDIAIAATNTTVGFVDATWAANINTYSATNTTGYSRRLCYMLY